MTIPGRGDLSPRRRHHRPLRWLTVVVVLGLIGAGGYLGVRHFRGDDGPSRPAHTVAANCPSHAPSPFPAPHTVRLRIVNGSLQTGLAAQVRNELRHRKFRVASIGNALKVGHFVAQVHFSSDEQQRAALLSLQVPGRAALKPVSGTGVLELDLGLRFHDLLSAGAAKAAETRASAALTGTPTPSPSPTCRPAG